MNGVIKNINKLWSLFYGKYFQFIYTRKMVESSAGLVKNSIDSI